MFVFFVLLGAVEVACNAVCFCVRVTFWLASDRRPQNMLFMVAPGGRVHAGDALQLPQELRPQRAIGTAHPPGVPTGVASLHALRAQDAGFTTQL